MSEQVENQEQASQEAYLAKMKEIYEKVIVLFGMEITDTKEKESKDLPWADFTIHLEMINTILQVKRVDTRLMTPDHILLLVYYYIGCQLKKRGIINDSNYGAVKTYKMNEVMTQYHPPSGGDPDEGGVITAGSKLNVGKGFCESFYDLIEMLRKTIDLPVALGSIGGFEDANCCNK